MKDGETKLVFDLEIDLGGAYFNKLTLTIQDFLDVNDSISQMLEDLLDYQYGHVALETSDLNSPRFDLKDYFSEKTVRLVTLKGTVNGIVFYDSDGWLDTLIYALKKLSDKYDGWWIGEFREYTGEDVFRYKAPDFKIEELN
tara:strand:+ start:1511 stop:1936 length:426 start_codon:yes stop_codon:yes gene_type:complete